MSLERLADLLPGVAAQLAVRHLQANGTQPMTTDAFTAAVDDIRDEAERAMAKFATFNSSHEGYAVILEELDEMWDEIKANDLPRSIEEAVQVGAMALRYVVEMRQTLEQAGAA